MEESSLIAHLDALREMLIRCLVVLGIGIIPMFIAAPYGLDLLISVISGNASISLNYFTPLEVFVLQIKMALTFDLLICFPYIAHHIWAFVAPALYENERRIVKLVVWMASLLFILGVLFCLFFIMPMIIRFGLSFATPDIKAVFGVANLVSLCLRLSVVFGLMFQFPLIVYFLIRNGIVEYQWFQERRPYVVVCILIAAALLTPPDIVSQLMLAVPTYMLYEAALWLVKRKCSKG